MEAEAKRTTRSAQKTVADVQSSSKSTPAAKDKKDTAMKKIRANDDEEVVEKLLDK